MPANVQAGLRTCACLCLFGSVISVLLLPVRVVIG